MARTPDFIETEAVKELIDQYFQAVYHADIAKLKELFHEKAAMYGYLGPNQVTGAPRIFLDDIGSKPSMASSTTDCRAVIKQIHITGNIASVILFVDGFYGEACVEDNFHLLKADGEWQIVCKTFTTA